jgi:GDP-L-fucose synthase
MPESELLTGPLEPTNQWYAVAKIAGIMLCRAYRRQHGCDFISAMPTNLYGPGDNFDLQASHVIPALIAKAHRAKEQGGNIPVWGTGSPLREFMHVDDLADAVVFLMQCYDGEEHVNVGTGEEISVRELAERIASIVGVASHLRFEPDKPDGMPRKLLDTGKLRGLGWRPRIGLDEGLRSTYAWYVKQLAGAAA